VAGRNETREKDGKMLSILPNKKIGCCLHIALKSSQQLLRSFLKFLSHGTIRISEFGFDEMFAG
jgi:hypothetical protein